MKSDGKPTGARLGFRVFAGIISALTLTTALPMSVIVAVRGNASIWLVAFSSLLVGIGFATVAFTGHWLCLNRAHVENDRS